MKDDAQLWPCCNKNCKSFLKLRVTNEIIEKQTDHNHNQCGDTVLNRQKLNAKLKEKAYLVLGHLN